MNILFLSLVLILAIASLTTQKSVSALIAFGLMMVLLGGYYIYLDEKLLGLFQIFVYAGGISVLMLFGITLIGTDFPPTRERPFAIFLSVAFFGLVTTLFMSHVSQLPHHATTPSNPSLFSDSYGDFVIIFALIGASLLYATIKMAKLLQSQRGQDV
ncbi:MAG: hypothetical protein KU38_11385 [Sulfurovum sp. FS08-3]|nr:MAG: hypothetical protein KU38_11385 [Sulfurovum sp. FS08-3]